MVQETPFYSKIENIPKSFLRSVWHPTGDSYNYYRPVSTSGYILGAWISTLIHNDIRPWIFHLTNMLLQMGVVILLFSLLLRFGARRNVAFFGALALIVHPMSAGTLAWIPGQNELLLALCVVGGFLAFMRALEDPRWFLLHGFYFLVGALTKENVVGLPILCAMFLAFSEQRKQLLPWLFALVTWGTTIGIWLFMVNMGGSGAPPAAGSALQGLMHGLPFILIYLGQLTLPLGLSTLPIPMDVHLHFWIAGSMAAVASIALAVWRFRVRPLVIIGLCWFGGFLWPTFANMTPDLKDLFILRTDRSYLASIGLILVVLQLPWETWFVRRSVRVGGGLLAIVLIALNLQHQFNFSSGMNYYQSAVAGSPRSSFAHTHLGDMYLYVKDIPRAIQQYQRAIELNYYEPQVHNNLGVAYMRSGNIEKAAEEYLKELSFNPNNLLTWSNLGSIYLQKGDHANAEIAFRKAVQINPAYKDAWLGLYKIYDFQKRFDKRDEAKRYLDRAEIDMSRGI